MSKRNRVVARKPKRGDASVEAAAMFNQMTGADAASIDVVKPKYDTLKGYISSISRAVRSAAVDVVAKAYSMDEVVVSMTAFCNGLDAIPWIKDDDDAKLQDAILEHYAKLKKSKTVNTFVCIGGNFIECYKALSTGDDTFVHRVAGPGFTPLLFCQLDFKAMWVDPATTPQIKKYWMAFMKMIADKCQEIYKLISSPDSDIKKFSETMTACILETRKLPQFDRCQGAFDILDSKVQMLENNFDRYYRDFTQSKNPNVIIEHYVMDVAKSSPNSPELTRQFHTIARHYRNAQSRAENPAAHKILDLFNQNINQAEDDAA
jgi:hypothetical protein